MIREDIRLADAIAPHLLHQTGRDRTNKKKLHLLEASCVTRDRWEHIVYGNGIDAGFRFSYFWHRPAINFTLPDELRAFMTPHYIPELYN